PFVVFSDAPRRDVPVKLVVQDRPQHISERTALKSMAVATAEAAGPRILAGRLLLCGFRLRQIVLPAPSQAREWPVGQRAAHCTIPGTGGPPGPPGTGGRAGPGGAWGGSPVGVGPADVGGAMPGSTGG